MKRFLSGDEALAEGVRLARPQVISAYPITPQTVVVERLSEMVEDGSLAAEYVHVESEHSALSCAIGASATGARTFTATSSQGLLYMAECLTYASGGRFPIVMMNANRATALPWNIYGDQRDSLSLLDHGWIQVYAENNQEALDLALMAYAVAEDPAVRTPVMVNLDGQRTYRIFENLLVNIMKYAMPGTRAYVNLEQQERFVVVTLMNISASEISVSPQELMERFVRGDESRNTEGSGLGLAIAKSFTELQEGTMELSLEGDLFRVVLRWKMLGDEA